MRSNGRRRLRRGLTLLCAVGLVLPVTAGVGGADPRSELDEVRRQLDGARGGLEQIEGDRAVTIADLEESQARQAVLDDRLRTLNSELHSAQGSLADADATLHRTTADLDATEQQLVATRQDLDGARESFAERARASYMYGGAASTSTSVVFGISDVTSFNRALSYVERVMASDRQQVALVGNLERQVEATAAELALVQERHRRERQVAQVERDRVAGLVHQQQDLHDQVAAEAARHESILAQLDEDKATHVAMIDSLEAESDRLEEDLRRRAEEARKAAAEEARRVAAAAAARASRSAAAPAPAPAPPPQATASGWRRPSDGRTTSGYGWRRHPIYGTSRMHTGVDFGAPMGAPIYAATGGTVVSAGWRGGYGLAVVIDHGGGVATLYAHTSRVVVSPGQHVSRGQVVARTGSTGQSTGPHLHFEVRVNGQHRDPMRYL